MNIIEDDKAVATLIRFLINATNRKEKYEVENGEVETFKKFDNTYSCTKYEIYLKMENSVKSLIAIYAFTISNVVEEMHAIIHEKDCLLKINSRIQHRDILRYLNKLMEIASPDKKIVDSLIKYLDNL
jgi:hypothetical protein